MSQSLFYTTAASSLILLGGCNQQKPDWTAHSDRKICVDRDGNRVTSTTCPTRAEGGYGMGGFYPYFLPYGAMMPGFGQRALGGFSAPRAGVGYSAAANPSTVSRGGFGSSAEAHGGFGGGE